MDQQEITTNSEKNLEVRDNKTRILLLICVGLGFLGGLVGAGVINMATGTRPISSLDSGLLPKAVQSNEAVVNVVDRVSSAVVAVTITKNVPQTEIIDPFGGGLFGPSPFRIRLKQPGNVQPQDVGGGSGFVVDPSGLIITNKHVVSDSTASYTVTFKDGEKLSAKVVARDPLYDLALVKVNKDNLSAVQFADSNTLRVGQSVVAIGNALGQFPNSVSAGIVSGLSRQIQAGDAITGQVETLSHVIQTDAAINPGNSGGPLLDLSGKVVGVNTAVAGSAENISFAIPSNEAARVLRDYQKDGRVVRAVLGVRYVMVTPEIKREKNLTVDNGALLVRGGSQETAILSGSGAEKAGLKEGDIILKVNGTLVTKEQTLQTFIDAKRPGNTLTLTVLSDGKEKNIEVTLTEAT